MERASLGADSGLDKAAKPRDGFSYQCSSDAEAGWMGVTCMRAIK
jgi:hypothetical protein